MEPANHWNPPTSTVIDGLNLRMYSLADVADLQYATFESYEHLRPWMPWASDRQTLDQTERIVRRIMAGYIANEDYTIGCWDGESYVGGTGFHLRCGPLEWRCAEIGMWVRGSLAGQGYGTKMLDSMLQWGFETWGWERLIWKCDTRNIASSRVAEKCGMTREATFRSDALDVDGKRRDTHLYAILKSEWRTR